MENVEVKIILDQLKNISEQQRVFSRQQNTANERLARLEAKAEDRERRDAEQDKTINQMQNDIVEIKNKESALQGSKGALALVGSYALAIYSMWHRG